MYIDNFYFNAELGVTTEGNGAKHVQGLNGTTFCPLADNHTVYYDHLEKQKEAKSERNKRHYDKCKS